MNLMKVNGYQARILYDEMTGELPVEILRLSGGADLFGFNPDQLLREFQRSLDVYLEVCKEQ